MSDLENPDQHQQPPTPGAVQLRASDAERRRTASILHEALGKGQLTIEEFDERTAQAWAAVYVDDLAPLTADLVVPGPAAPSRALVSADVQPPASERVTGDGGPSLSVAVWSGFERKGVWTVPPRFTAIAVMGGGDIDLRYANFGAQEITITAVAIMGGIDIIVPDDVFVRERGFGFMGAFNDDRKWDDQPLKPPPGAPIVTVQGLALMGGVSITRRPSGPKQVQRRDS